MRKITSKASLNLAKLWGKHYKNVDLTKKGCAQEKQQLAYKVALFASNSGYLTNEEYAEIRESALALKRKIFAGELPHIIANIPDKTKLKVFKKYFTLVDNILIELNKI